MNTIIFSSILFFSFLLLSFVLKSDRISIFLPKKVELHSDAYSKAILQVSVILTIFIFSALFLFTEFNINLDYYFQNFPFLLIFIFIYFLFIFLDELAVSKAYDVAIAAKDTSHKFSNYHYYDYKLIEEKNKLSRMERKLNTLKSFSFTPIILLLINDFPSLLNTLSLNQEKTMNDYTTILLVTLSALYFTVTYRTYKHCQTQNLTITYLEMQRVKMKYNSWR